MNTYTAGTYGETASCDELLKVVRTIEMIPPVPEIRVTDYLPTEWVQKKRHKRKSSRRWQKKWRKRFGMKEIGRDKIYQIGNMILMSPETKRALDKQIQNHLDDSYRKQCESFWFGREF